MINKQNKIQPLIELIWWSPMSLLTVKKWPNNTWSYRWGGEYIEAWQGNVQRSSIQHQQYIARKIKGFKGSCKPTTYCTWRTHSTSHLYDTWPMSSPWKADLFPPNINEQYGKPSSPSLCKTGNNFRITSHSGIPDELPWGIGRIRNQRFTTHIL